MLCALALLLAAQAAGQDATIRTHVPLVIAPATVTTRSGRYVDGLSTSDFVLLEDGKPRPFEMDTSDIAMTPLSVVIAIEANDYARAALAKIRKTGSMIQPLVTGERGEAAILSFGDDIKTVQEFTADAALISNAFRGIEAQKGSRARACSMRLQGRSKCCDRVRKAAAGF